MEGGRAGYREVYAGVGNAGKKRIVKGCVLVIKEREKQLKREKGFPNSAPQREG